MKILLSWSSGKDSAWALHVVPIPHPCPNAVYEARMATAVARAVDDGFTHVAFGDLFLEDVRQYRVDRLAGTGLTPLFPIWGIPTRELAGRMIGGGLRARLACVDTRVLDAGFAGREFDAALLRDLPPEVDPCGENGEFHTCVYDGPMFRAPIRLAPGETVTRETFVWRDQAPIQGQAPGVA